MPVREVITIDEELCDGCGQCVPACAEGALAIVGGKATLVSDVLCDGLGACLGHCPQGAITVQRVDAHPFDPAAVARRLHAEGPSRKVDSRLPGASGRLPVVGAHVTSEEPPEQGCHGHPEGHGAHAAHGAGGGCPGSRTMVFAPRGEAPPAGAAVAQPSALRQWPVQLHLVSPAAPYFRGADVLLAADCVAFAVGDFHATHLSGRSLAIACPKLDSRQDVYLDKLTALIDGAAIASLTVMVMEVPCCGGLVQAALQAASRASREVPMRYVVVGVHGDILEQGPLERPRRNVAGATPRLGD